MGRVSQNLFSVKKKTLVLYAIVLNAKRFINIYVEAKYQGGYNWPKL